MKVTVCVTVVVIVQSIGPSQVLVISQNQGFGLNDQELGPSVTAGGAGAVNGNVYVQVPADGAKA